MIEAVDVVGAGAVGGTLAALLDRAGVDVRVVVRRAELARAIRADGLRLTGAEGEHIARLDADVTVRPDTGLVVLATKVPGVADAVRAHLDRLGGPLLLVQNGVDAIDLTRSARSAGPLLAGLVTWACHRPGPTRVAISGTGALRLGLVEGAPSLLDDAVQVLGRAVPTTTTDDVRGAQWSKLVINQLNALPAITGTSVQAVAADDQLAGLLAHGVAECVRVGLALGVRFAPTPFFDHDDLAAAADDPVRATAIMRRQAAAFGPVPNEGSTLQSIRRGEPTEIDWLNGAVVRGGEATGIVAPVNAAMVALVHEVERTHRFLGADEVLARL